MRIICLLTVHNRKVQTLACLEALFNQKHITEEELSVLLVDDGSTDGTTRDIRIRFPQVQILEGDGNLFWNRGMHWAFSEGMKKHYDHYLWLNNDTLLYPDSLYRLLSISKELGEQSVVVGSIQDPINCSHTYGGLVKSGRWHPLKLKPVLPKDVPISVDTMNGNCVLIPDSAALLVGNLDPSFTHGIGDIDYGLRAKKKGVNIWIVPGYIGSCSRNNPQGSWMDKKLPFFIRLRKLIEPKVIPPKEWAVFTRRHGGVLWPLYWVSPYLRKPLS